MAGELSPDRLYYWDGARWVSSISPDGAWRWNGQAWRPNSPPGLPSRFRAIVAAVVVVSVVVSGFGIYEVASWAAARTQSLLRTEGIDVACSEPGATAGAHLGEHDRLCGRPLGAAYYQADCLAPAAPNGGRFLDAMGDGAWDRVDVQPDGSGCPIDAEPNHERMFTTAEPQPATSTLIVDFTAQGWEGGVGVQVACADHMTCIDFGFFGDGYYTLDQGNPAGKWDNLTNGHLGTFTGMHPEVGTEYRLIVRLDGRAVEVFLDGREITHANATAELVDGYADFYSDARGTSGGEPVSMQKMFLFETLKA